MNLFSDSITRLAVVAQAATPTPPATDGPANPGIIPEAPPMAGLPAGTVGQGIALSLLFVFLVIAFVAVKAYKMRVGAIVLGACIGTLGATGFVGALCWSLISIVVKLITGLSSSFG